MDCLKNKLAEVDLLKKEVENRGYSFVDLAINIIVSSTDLKKVRAYSQYAKNALYDLNDGTPFIENYGESLGLFFGSMCGNAHGNYRNFKSVDAHAISYMFFDSNQKGYDQGHLFTNRLGEPLLYNLWENQFIQSRNGIVEGKTGSGKSFLVNSIITQDLEQGYHVIVLDKGHSYRDLSNTYNGVYFDSAILDSLCLNIFYLEKDIHGKYDLYKGSGSDKVDFITSIIIAIWKNIDESISNVELSLLNKIISNYYNHCYLNDVTPLITSFYSFLDHPDVVNDEDRNYLDLTELKITLEPFVIGSYKSLFLSSNDSRNIKDEPFVVFDLDSVSNNRILYPVLSLLVMETVIQKIHGSPHIKKRFIIDEGWDVLTGSLSGFVEYLYRTIRKQNGSIWIATQLISDLRNKSGNSKTSESESPLIENTSTIILLPRMGKIDRVSLTKYLGLTDNELSIINSLSIKKYYREFYLKQEEFSTVLRIEVSKETALIYSSTKEDKLALDKFKDEGKSIKGAVNQFFENELKL